MPTVIILGSARSDGDTKVLVNKLAAMANWDLVDLNDYSFSHYDYEHLNRDDDFLPLIKRLLEEYDTLVFATPVYWYAMSGLLKVFFDRITDLLTIEKEAGRKLRGKRTATVSCSIGNNLGDQFWLPFRKTAEYLGMHYLADVHLLAGEDKLNEDLMNNFVRLVEKQV